MKCYYIYNPKSGKGKVYKYLDTIISTLKSIYDIVDVHESESSIDIIQSVKKASNMYDAIIFSGGDGTFNDVACGLSSCEVRPFLGYIPTGTGNDIAKNIKIPRNPIKALKIIKEQKFIYHDVGMINNQYFIYVAALGSGSSASFTTEHQAKKILGRFAYVIDGMKEFFSPNLIKAKIEYQENTIEMTTPLVLVLNTKTIGGMIFNRYSNLNDGSFDILLVNNGAAKGRFNVIKLFLKGMLGLKKRPAVYIKSNEFRITVNDSFTWTCDGNEGPKGTITVKNLHNHLKIFAPRKKARKQKRGNDE